MKRPPGIWFLLSAGVLWLSIHNVYGLKATELIFKKSSSTTTTTGTSVSSEQPVDEVSTEAASDVTNVTKSLLTGNPQIDYVYDPNLPRELNGYNLSTYPFYDSLPKNITFKCDGLHDGFYASIPHKCQVYHHCISGIRYDFLCANYTAFDQTIFNCHFVSEVDCNNSHKFWHRNDALYKSASTTTTIQPTPIVISPALTGSPKRPPSPLGRRRTPPRRRPQYDEYEDEEYYDEKEDDYEPPPRRRRKRPRPRPRPMYDDEYEEYEDRYERRSSGRRNEERRREYGDDDKRSYEKPTNRHVDDEKQMKRNDDRRREYDDDNKKPTNKHADEEKQVKRNEDRRREYEDEGRPMKRNEDRRREYEDDDRHSYDKPPSRHVDDEKQMKRNDDRRRDYADDNKKPTNKHADEEKQVKRNEDRRREYEDDDRRPYEKPANRHADEEKQEKRNDKRKPYDDRQYKDERRREYEKEDDEDDYTPRRRPSEKRRPSYERPRKSQRRPHDDDLYEDEKNDDRRVHKDQPQKVPKVQQPESDSSVLVKPQGPSSVYNQPRMPPRIKPPVPKNAQKSTSEKPTTTSEKPTTTKKPLDETEYYDDYEDEVPTKVTATSTVITTTKMPELETTNTRLKFRTTQKLPSFDDEYKQPPSISSSPKTTTINGEIGIRYTIPKFIKETRTKPTTTASTTTTTTTSSPTTTTTTTTATTTTTTTEVPKEKPEPVVRVMKRPFLPSRGGNPYFVRGLQPVGAKALDPTKYESDPPDVLNNQTPIQNGRQFPTQFPAKEPLSNKPIAVSEPEVPQISTQPKFVPKIEEPTRAKPNVPERNPLDINEDDYDVTLNDALNPTIPNLPVRSFPTGFGAAPSDYIYDALQRQRFNVGYNIPPESFLPKTVRQRDETVVAQPQTFRNQYYNQNFRPNSQITQANAHGFYRSF